MDENTSPRYFEIEFLDYSTGPVFLIPICEWEWTFCGSVTEGAEESVYAKILRFHRVPGSDMVIVSNGKNAIAATLKELRMFFHDLLEIATASLSGAVESIKTKSLLSYEVLSGGMVTISKGEDFLEASYAEFRAFFHNLFGDTAMQRTGV